MTDLSQCAQGGQCSRDDLGRPLAVHITGGLGLQQLGVGENDTELVVQAMKERLERLSSRFVGIRADDRRGAHAGEPGAVLASDSSERVAGAASRQSVSAKIRMDPPAVLTYSTLPAEIQL